VSRFQPTSPTSGILYADSDTNLPLPIGPLNGQPIVPGYEIVVVDNLQSASANPITITGQFAGGTSVQIATSGGAYRFRWNGTFYMMGV
jgi:hypothetical protein